MGAGALVACTVTSGTGNTDGGTTTPPPPPPTDGGSSDAARDGSPKCVVADGGTACDQCIAANCCSENQACVADRPCVDLATCAEACIGDGGVLDRSCYDTCKSATPAASVTLYETILSCTTSKCIADGGACN
jgi:hypothetical protein